MHMDKCVHGDPWDLWPSRYGRDQKLWGAIIDLNLGQGP